MFSLRSPLIFMLTAAVLFSACVKKPKLPSSGDPVFTGWGWYVIDDANDAVTGISMATFSAYPNVMPDANSAIIADLAFVPGMNRAYVAGGYFSGQGSSDIKAYDLDSKTVVASHSLGAGQTVTSGAFGTENGLIYAAFYASAGDGRYRRLDQNLLLQKDIFLGGMPQALAVKNGDVYVANTDSYANATNWVDCMIGGNGPAVRQPIASANPVSLALSSDGLTLYILCAGTYAGNNGSIVVVTNAPTGLRGVKGTCNLGFNTWGKILNANGRIFFTTANGLYELNPTTLTAAQVALTGIDVNDIDTDGAYLYITPGWGGTACRILDASTLSLVRSITVDGGGMGALSDP